MGEGPQKRYKGSHWYIDDTPSNEITKRLNIQRKRRGPKPEHCIPPMLKSWGKRKNKRNGKEAISGIKEKKKQVKGCQGGQQGKKRKSTLRRRE